MMDFTKLVLKYVFWDLWVNKQIEFCTWAKKSDAQNKFGNPFTVFMSYIGHEILLTR